MTPPLIVFGCGGHGKVVADAALASGRRVLGFADDAARHRGTFVLGLPVLGIGLDETLALCHTNGAETVLAIGDNRTRQGVFAEFEARGLRLATVVHPSAVLAPSAIVGRGSVIFARAVLNPDALLGENVIVNTGVCIDHDNSIGAHAHLSPGVVLGGMVSVGQGSHLGIGVTVRNNISIGSWTVVGVGSSVVHNIPDGVVAYGVPARVVRPAT